MCCHDNLLRNLSMAAESFGGKIIDSGGESMVIFTLACDQGEYELRVCSAANPQLFPSLVCEDRVEINHREVMVKNLPDYASSHPQEWLLPSAKIAEELLALRFEGKPEDLAFAERERKIALASLKEGFRKYSQGILLYFQKGLGTMYLKG